MAMNGEFKDAAVAAVERLADRADLELIASRANNKNAMKRARTILRELDERIAADAAPAAPPLPRRPARRRPSNASRSCSASRRSRRTRRAGARGGAPGRGQPAGRRWTPPPIPSSRRGSRPPRPSLRARLAAARALEHERARRRGRGRPPARRRGWRRNARPPTRPPPSSRAKRLNAAASACSSWSSRSRRPPPTTICGRRDGASALAQREWKDMTADAAADGDLAARFAAAETRLTARDAEAKEADRRARREALNRLQQLLARVEPLASRDDLSLKAAERALATCARALGAMPPLPSKQDYDDGVRRLKAVQAALTPKLQELREIEGWQRWANVGIQEQLCEKMEALEGGRGSRGDRAPDPRAAAAVAPGRRRAARAGRGAVAALQGGARRGLGAMRSALCRGGRRRAREPREEDRAVRARRGARRLDQLDSDGRRDQAAAGRMEDDRAGLARPGKADLGTVPRRLRSILHPPPRGSRPAQGGVGREPREEGRAVRAGPRRSPNRPTGTRPRPRSGGCRREWKTIGPVKKSRSEAIWQRFRAACDRFFARYAQRHEIARAERVAAREAICAELEALRARSAGLDAIRQTSERRADGCGGQEPPGSARHGPLAARALAAGDRARGVDPRRARALDRRFAAAFARVIARWPAGLRRHRSRSRREPQAHGGAGRRVEELAASLGGPAAADADAALSPTTRLAAMLKEALAANTIGGKVDEEAAGARRRKTCVRRRRAGRASAPCPSRPAPARRSLPARVPARSPSGQAESSRSGGRPVGPAAERCGSTGLASWPARPGDRDLPTCTQRPTPLASS